MITFRRAVRENIRLIIGLIGPSWSGKTFSALELATGISGDDPFAVIDTENRRSRHYADKFKFDCYDLDAPWRPEKYTEAIIAADKAGYKAIVVDSCSHEWAGTGGVLEWQEEELQRMAGDNWSKREQCKMAAWIRPKMAHKKMVQNFLQINAQLILCFRAEEKTKMVMNEKGKMEPVPAGWQPICEKNLPYELICSFLMDPDNPGVPQPIKLEDQHKNLFPPGQKISREMGRELYKWSTGGEIIKTISKSQTQELWKIACNKNMSKEALAAIVQEKWGYIKSLDIQEQHFKEICEHIESLEIEQKEETENGSLFPN